MEEDELDPDVTALHWVSCHHKTSRRGFGPIAIDIPPGPLKRMLLVHINIGYDLLTSNSVALFNSPTGKAFTNAVRGMGNEFQVGVCMRYHHVFPSLMYPSLTPLSILPAPPPSPSKSFCWYFRCNVLNGAAFAAFAPVKCRTVFVESYTARLGSDPTNWDDSIDGVATVW